jgi:glycosyltransferase involved in cell wall biosynthesis
MKIPPSADISKAKDTITGIPTTVCMHVLGVVRTDYRVMREAVALVEAGYVVSIIDVESERTGVSEENIEGVHVKHIVRPGWFVSTRFKPWFLVKAALMIVQSIVLLLSTPADIYHAHDAHALPACYCVARLRRKPLIFDAHELPLDEPNITRWKRLSAFAQRVLSGMLPQCTGIIASSPPTAQEMRKRYAIREVCLVRNVPVYRQVARSDRLRRYLGLDADVRIALYQGYLLPDRGLDRLVHVASFLEPNTVIVIMGKGIGNTQVQLLSLIASEGVGERVKIIPPVPYSELLDWTASADVGLIILPLDYSLAVRLMLPNKLFEYIMAGLPVLASKGEAITDVIETYDIGFVVHSLTPADVGAAINALLADPAARERMRGNALIAAHNELFWEKEKKQLIHLYQTILGEQSTGGKSA